MKKRQRVLFVVVGVLVLLVGAYTLLKTPTATRLIVGQASDYLRKNSNIDLQASRMSLDLLHGAVTLENVVLRSTSATELPPFFQASRISARIGVAKTIRGLLAIKDLRISSPRVYYYIGKDGKTNLPPARKTSEPAPRFLITHADVENGSFQYVDIRSNFSVSLPQWRLLVDGDTVSLDHQINLTTQQPVLLKADDRFITLQSFRFTGALQNNNDSLRLDLAQMASRKSTLSIRGTLKDFSHPVLTLRLEPSLDLAEIKSFMGGSKLLEGNLSGRIDTDGPLENLDLKAELKGSGITALEYRNASFDSSIHAVRNPESILLRAFRLESPEGSVSGDAEFSTAGRTNSIRAVLQRFDLLPVWKLINPPFDLASRSSGKISLNWSGSLNQSSINADANLNLIATRSTPGKYLLPITGNIDAQVRSGRVNGNLRGATIMGTQLDGRFSLFSFKTIEAAVHGETSDVRPALSQISAFIGDPAPSPLGIDMGGPLQFNAQVSEKLSEPKIVVAAESASLQAGDVKDLRVNADATIQGSRIPFQASIALPDTSTVSAKGEFDLGGSKTSLKLDAGTEHIPASAVFPILGSSVPATGDLKADLHLEGPLDSLSGNAHVSGNDVTIYREPLGRFDTELQISNSKIQSNQFRCIRDPQRPDTNYIDAVVSYGLSSGEFEFQASGKDLIWGQQQLSGGKILDGTFNVTASGQGTFAQPSMDVKLESGNLQVRQRPLGPISVSAVLRGEQATLEALAPKINASSTGYISTHAPYHFSGDVQINNSDLAVLGITAANQQPLTGTLTATLRGSGDLDDVAAARFSAQIQRLKLNAGTLEAHTEGTLEAEYRDRAISILSPATVVSGNSKVEVAGKVSLDQAASSGSLTLKGQIDLAQATGFIPTPEGFAAAGALNLDLSLSGTTRKLSTAGTIMMDDGSVRLPQLAIPLSHIILRANLENGSLVIERAEAMAAEGSITLKGELPFGLLPRNLPVQFPRKEGPARFDIDIANFKPEATGLLPQGVQGIVSVHASGQATSTDLHTLNAEIVFRQLNFKANEIALGQKENSTIVVRNGIATISTFALSGIETNIEATGSAGLLPGGPLNLKLLGDFDAALLTFMDRNLKLAGRMKVQAAVGGNRRSPMLSGTAEMIGGRFTLRDPRVVADSLTVRLDLTPNQVTVREFKSTLNGGTLTMSGTVGYERGSLNKFNLKATIQDVFMNFPDGLRSASNGTLTITSADDAIVVGGTIRVLDSSYREQFTVTGPLMSFLRSQRVVVEGTEPSPLLERIRFDVALRTTTPVLVQNNIAKAEATANLRIVGTFYEPSIVGRVTLDQGGEIVMNSRTYYIERGTITLNDQTQIRPELDIEAQTKVDTYEITLRLTGPMERLSTALSSEPSLPEQDIISLLLTGKTSSESTQQVARTQALALVAGQAGEEITREARQALHLSTFRLDPGGLIASESDIGATLTIGEDITKDFSLAYSMDLVNTGKQIWAAQYKINRNFTTQATKQEDNSYRGEFRHDLRFGGTQQTRTSRTRQQTKFTIGSIQFEGSGAESDKALLERFKVKPGDKFDFPKVQKGLDRLHSYYSEQKRLEADIRLQRETRDKTVDLEVSVKPGAVIEFSYEGMPLPDKVKKDVEQAWKNGVFDVERLEDATAVIRRQLLENGYLQAGITHRIETQDDRKIVHFSIEPGTLYGDVPILTPGSSGIGAAELHNALARANLELDIYADPQKVADYLKQYYRERGYLQANVDLPLPRLDANTGTGEVSIPVHEGPLFLVGDLEFSGNKAFDYDQLWSVIPTSSGSIYNPKSMQDATRAAESLYHRKGYNDVSVTYRVYENTKTARANVTFQVTERRQSIIREIAIEGNTGTSQNFIRRQLDFNTGDVLDLNRIDETRKRLYATGVYTSVDFQNEELPDPADSSVKNIRVLVRVREVRPWRVQYGFFMDTQRGPGGLLEAQNLNLFGRASSLGMKLRYDSDLKEARVYYNQPFVKNNFPKMDSTAFVQRETRVAFDSRRIGFSLFRQKALQRKYVFDYGYRYDYVRWNGLPPDPTLYQSSAPVSRLVASVTRDTRDSILDATHGEFTSHSFEFGPEWLGSETGFARYSGQYFRYVPLDKYLGKAVKDKEGNRLPASLVYAGALRLGLATAFSGNKDLISPERFFAGGGTTMRGFKQDLLGPTVLVVDPDTGQEVPRPTGGEGLFLFNNEIRFPIISIFQGVGFVDIGNVYQRLSDFNFNLRKSAGFGLRIKVKFIPIRFDYGFKLDRRPDESRGAFFFSIGQAF